MGQNGKMISSIYTQYGAPDEHKKSMFHFSLMTTHDNLRTNEIMTTHDNMITHDNMTPHDNMTTHENMKTHDKHVDHV